MAQKLLFGLGGLIVLAITATLFLVRQDPLSPKPDPSTAASPSISSELPELSAFVEETRGLEFRNEVELAVLSEPAFQEELNKLAADRKDTGRVEAVLSVLGMATPETDVAALRGPSDQGTAAFYDPAKKELVTTKDLTPFVRKVLVHELTHALDDQHFGIDRDLAGDQAAAAFAALVEGSAIRVERLYLASLPSGQQEEIRARDEQVSEEPPSAVEQLLGFPELFGPSFVEALVDAGPDRLNQAFSSPPTSAEQVLDPARYLAGDATQIVARPHTEGTATDEGEFGQLLLQQLLESRLDPAVAKEAATGWDGDRYATWRSPDGRTCVRVRFATDSPEDSRQLQDALAAWVDRVTDREVDSAGLLLKACGR
ncbi:MAG TPA: hypothetical protein VHI31_05060 [Actinomycetota bacterium]|nr:hypothetical protein [Actinomycetota bacterium]